MKKTTKNPRSLTVADLKKLTEKCSQVETAKNLGRFRVYPVQLARHRLTDMLYDAAQSGISTVIYKNGRPFGKLCGLTAKDLAELDEWDAPLIRK